MRPPGIDIRALRDEDVDAVVEFSVRAWTPIFESLRTVLGDSIFRRLHPDWAAGQAAAVRSTCTDQEMDVFVAVGDSGPVGFVAVALNAFHDRMGAIDMIAVAPEHQRRGVATALTDSALAHMRQAGMDIAVVETGGDPGHEPARRSYEASGFTQLPIARYFQLLG